MIICGPLAFSLSENSESQLPHFVANRSLKALTTESTAINTHAVDAASSGLPLHHGLME
jgi:hypothetical protein